MINVTKMLEVVCDHFETTPEEISKKCNKPPFPLIRKIIIHLMHDHPTAETMSIVNLTQSGIYQYRAEMARVDTENPELAKVVKSIQYQCQSSMTIKLNHSQLKSLHEVINDFIQKKCFSVIEELLVLILDDINEKLRKRIRAGKENLSLDEKQERAFVIWHYYASRSFEITHQHAYMTSLDIINQIKPGKKTFPIIN